jgi:hypothetical protein
MAKNSDEFDDVNKKVPKDSGSVRKRISKREDKVYGDEFPPLPVSEEVYSFNHTKSSNEDLLDLITMLSKGRNK